MRHACRTPNRMTAPLVLGVVIALTGVACGPGQVASPTQATGPSGEGTVEYPLTVQNCDDQVVFDKAPERVMLVDSSQVPALQELGVLDRAVARAGAYPDEYYDADTRAAIAAVPSLGEELDDVGHLQISQDTIIAQDPDLLFGLPDGITRESLAQVGINVLIEPAFCPGDKPTPSFDSIYTQVEYLGRVFDREAAADQVVGRLKERVESTRASLEGAPQRTAAVLFPTVSGGSGFAYGIKSMAHPQLEAAGFTNVFGDVNDRVFEVTTEELINRNPDVLILLYVGGDPEAVKNAITSLPGADRLKAVQDDAILVQLFNFSEPPTPLVLDGLERIAEHFSEGT